MNAKIDPIPWDQFPMECMAYVMLVGCLVLPLFASACLVLALLPGTSPEVLSIRIARFGLFMGLFLAIGSLFNGLWTCLVFNRFYYSTDYFVDFIPFWPITQSVIDRPWGDEHGKLLGVTLLQVQLVWLLFALGTWGVTLFCYRLVHRLLGREEALLIRLSRLIAVMLFPCSLLITYGLWRIATHNVILTGWLVYVIWLGLIVFSIGISSFITRRMMRTNIAHHPTEPTNGESSSTC